MTGEEPPDHDSWVAFWLALAVTAALLLAVGSWFVRLMEGGP